MKKTLWTIQILLALLFLFAGGSKFVMPADQMTQGMPAALASGPFIHFIGVCEVLGGLGLVLPGLLRIQARPDTTGCLRAGDYHDRSDLDFRTPGRRRDRYSAGDRRPCGVRRLGPLATGTPLGVKNPASPTRGRDRSHFPLRAPIGPHPHRLVAPTSRAKAGSDQAAYPCR